MKTILFLLTFSLPLINISAQNLHLQQMGKTTVEELSMATYEKDLSASAVILEEKNFVYISSKKNYSYTNEYYVRIKILNKNAFKYGTIHIPYYKNSKLENLEGITYTLNSDGKIIKHKLSDQDVFKDKYSKNIKVEKFALPNLKVGAVIEFKMTISNNNYKIYDFEFQKTIPSIYSEYTAHLSSSDQFNVRLIGYIKPEFTESVIKKKCIGPYKCLQIKYVMKDIPAFMSEKYMTSKNNYISRVSFEEKYYDRFVDKGENRDWRSIDKWVKNSLENKLNQQSFYKRKLPDSILNEKNNLKKAKKVFYYIQNHFIRGSNTEGTFGQSYKNKVASSFRINISLYNALKAVGFQNTHFVMLSTRKNGLPTKLHATLDDFNADLVKIIIDDKKYLLDATDKLLSFGMISFECLNGNGRVFDFKKGSYWEPITPYKNNVLRIKMNLSLDEEDLITGTKEIIRTGYYALNRKHFKNKKTEEDYIADLEMLHSNIEIDKYQIINEKNKEEPLKEVLNIFIDVDDNSAFTLSSLLNLNQVNPFKLETRNYPVDYGYPNKTICTMSVKLMEGYEFLKTPKDTILALPNKGGSYIQKTSLKNGQLNIYLKFQISKTIFSGNEYQYLKQFYNGVIKAQKDIISFQKINLR